MISAFPRFKKLELSDREEVERFTLGFPSYSDFSFVSMFIWNPNDETLISRLNGNLIARLLEIRTQKTLYSFFGTTKSNDTATELLRFIERNGMEPELRVVPEFVISHLDKQVFQVSEDRDNFDYVLSTKDLSYMEGGKFESIRPKIRAFKNNAYEFRKLDISNPVNRSKILQCFESWADLKNRKTEPVDPAFSICVQTEAFAFQKLMASGLKLFESLICFGLFVDSVLVGFMIGEIVGEDCLIHFGKVDYKHIGTFQFLHQQTARSLLEMGITYLNSQEDLGLQSLRFAKSRYRPVHFQKKYTVRLKRSQDEI